MCPCVVFQMVMATTRQQFRQNTGQSMRADWKLRIALDAALAVPDRVVGLVLIAPAVTGAPPPDEESIEPELLWLDQKINEQIDLGDIDEANRYEVWLWLEGPRGPEGRVSGPARTLASEMNRIALTSNPVEAQGADVDARNRLEDIGVSTTVAFGSLDASFIIERSKTVAERIPGVFTIVLDGLAHLQLPEEPSMVESIVIQSITPSDPILSR